MRYHARILSLLRGLPRSQMIAFKNICFPEKSRRSMSLASMACFAMIAILVFPQIAVTQSTRAPKPERTLAPLRNERAPDIIPDQYIVVFKAGTSRRAVLAAQNRVKSLGGSIRHTYTSAPTGFSAMIPQSGLKEIRAIPGVVYLEPNRKRRGADTVQEDAPSGLDRTSERLLPLDGRYTFRNRGSGVNVYVIDSGIREHPQFNTCGRVIPCEDNVMPASRVATRVNFRMENGVLDANAVDDCNGHGTHIAGIIGGLEFGIAKQVTLHSVRFFGCELESNLDDEIAAVQWVTQNAIRPAVVNMSSEGNITEDGLFEAKVREAVASGITFVVAAGNGNTNACGVSPAFLPEVITVGATWPQDDKRWTVVPPPPPLAALGSNYGSCVTLFAPGVDILSAWPDGVPQGGCTLHGLTPQRTAFCTGTSMAAPHVAGVAALFLQHNQQASPADVKKAIDTIANNSGTAGWEGVVDRGEGSPNKLLHWKLEILGPITIPRCLPAGSCRPPEGFDRNVIIVRCDRFPCKIVDPLPRNCLTKWSCPGCSGPGLCPPFHHLIFDESVLPWKLGLIDKQGRPVRHTLTRTGKNVVLSVRPTKNDFLPESIADYSLVLEAGAGIKAGEEYKIGVKLQVSGKPKPDVK